jgi:hypothetical protein
VVLAVQDEAEEHRNKLLARRRKYWVLARIEWLSCRLMIPRSRQDILHMLFEVQQGTYLIRAPCVNPRRASVL